MLSDQFPSKAALSFLEDNLPPKLAKLTMENLTRVRRETHASYAPACAQMLRETGVKAEELEIVNHLGRYLFASN